MGVVRAARLERPGARERVGLAELVVQLGPVDYASGTKGQVPLVFPRWQLPPPTARGPGPLDPMWQLANPKARGEGRPLLPICSARAQTVQLVPHSAMDTIK